MIPSEPKKIDMPFAYEGARNDIPTTGGEDTGNASLSQGFPSITSEPITQGGIPPQRKDFNGLFYILSCYAHYAQSGGLFSWDTAVDYVQNCIITHNNNIYICVANNGVSSTAVEPGTNENYWQTLYTYLLSSDMGSVGSGTNPIYLNNGKFVASTSTVGSGTKPVYLNSGTITASGSDVGSGTKPIYMSSGTLTASGSTVGSGTKPMYMSSGTMTASSSTVGSGTKPVYMNSGTVTASSSTVGSGTNPVYMSSGTVTASSSTVGSTSQPVFLNNGSFQACTDTSSIPSGTITLYAGSSTPSGWFICNGANLSRTTYANLFSAIGTTWGSGDGSTTFTLPDFRNRVPQGVGGNSLGTSIAAGLPNISGSLVENDTYYRSQFLAESAAGLRWTGCFTDPGSYSCRTFSDASNTLDLPKGIYFDASSSNSIYGLTTTVQPPALAVYYIIKT